MADNAARRPLLVRTLLEVLREAGGPVPAAEAMTRVGALVQLYNTQLSRNKTGHRRYATALHYATMAFKNVGWLIRNRGTWELTRAGAEALDGAKGARELLLPPREFLQGIVDLLRERRHVILHGPPGTGKTHLAQHLAWHLIDRSMVRLMQFHPAYSYEDFFEGFRPIASAEGSGVAFRLMPGPLRCLVDAARENPGLPHVLIIDEINRANLAKVFGELYFLLECGCG